MPVFAKPSANLGFRLFGLQPDLRTSYKNGTKINYHCESSYKLLIGDMDIR